MTVVGSGGIQISRWRKLKRFHRDYDDLSIELKDKTDAALQDLARSPIPSGLRFEKLKGYSKPDIYTIHVTGNYKVSMDFEAGKSGDDGKVAVLRRVGTHNEIDRAP